MLKLFRNLKFPVKLSLAVFLIIALWILYGLLFKEKVTLIKEKTSGEGRITLLASEIEASQTHKMITGYGNVDRDRIDVVAEVNSHVNQIFAQEGAKIQQGESIVGLLGGIRIPAPMNGRLDRINVKKGGIVFAGQTHLFSIISLTKLDVILHVSANDARYIKLKDEVILQVNDIFYKGEVYFISKISNKANNSFEIKVRVKNEKMDTELFHDETVRVSIKTIAKRGFFVPTSAISINSANEIIITHVDNEGKIKKAKGEILQTFASGIWISSEELPNKPIIIIRGGDFVKEGDIPTFTLENFEQKKIDI
jgi:hypothetical protein